MKIWDGTSETRDDPSVRKRPDGHDWRTITAELKATQQFVVSLAANADNMPNLVEDIKACHKQLESVQESISKLTVPDDVKAHVDELRIGMEKLRSIYVHASEVLQTVRFLQRQLLNLNKRIDDHAENTDQKIASLENRVAHWQRVSEARWGARLDKAEEQIGAIALALGMKKFGE